MTGISTAVFDVSLINLHLLAPSPCINAGTYISGLTSDCESNPLPIPITGLYPDIGAYDTYKTDKLTGTLLVKLVIPGWTTTGTVNVLAFNNATNSLLYLENGYLKSYDGTNTASVNISALPGGAYVFCLAHDYASKTMKVGYYAKTPGVTWGADSSWVGAWPNYDTTMRMYYGAGAYPLAIGDIYIFSSELSDIEIKLVADKMLMTYTS